MTIFQKVLSEFMRRMRSSHRLLAKEYCPVVQLRLQPEVRQLFTDQLHRNGELQGSLMLDEVAGKIDPRINF